MKIEKVEDLSKQVERSIRFKTLYPLITAFGEGEQEFYWRFEGSTDRKDPLQPKVFIAPIASGNAVRSDRPFAVIKEPVRGTIAVDMEGAAFYRTMAGFPGIHSLFVKSVVDYADEDKDDLYHRYASKISARYMLAFIREYVTTRRLPIQ